MKPSKKKLNFSKETISNLTQSQLEHVKGGTANTRIPCPTTSRVTECTGPECNSEIWCQGPDPTP